MPVIIAAIRSKIIQIQGILLLTFEAPQFVIGTSLTFHPTNFFAVMVALWPPKPNELLTMAFTFISRAVLGT